MSSVEHTPLLSVSASPALASSIPTITAAAASPHQPSSNHSSNTSTPTYHDDHSAITYTDSAPSSPPQFHTAASAPYHLSLLKPHAAHSALCLSSAGYATFPRTSSAPLLCLPAKPTMTQSYSFKLGYVPFRFRDAAVSVLPTPLEHDEHDDDASAVDKSAGEWSCFAPGSINASIFNLRSATLGAGTLALPYAFAQCGVGAGTLLLLLAAIASIFSIHLLIACRDTTGLASYEDLSLFCFGKKFTLFVELNIVLFCFGCAVAYCVAVGDMLLPLSAGMPTLLQDKAHIMTLFVVTIMLPLSCVKQINELRFASLLGVLSIVFLVFVIVYRCSTQLLRGDLSIENMSYFSLTIRNVFIALPIIMFAFTCQVNVFSIYTELQRPTITRMKTVVNRAFFINFLIYFLTGCFGYMMFLSNTQSDILNNLSLADPLTALAQLAVGLTVVLAFPLNVYPARFSLEMMFFAKSEESTTRFYVITLTLVIGSLLLAIVTPNIDTVFAILGSTTSSFVCFILPALFYIKCMPGGIFSSDKSWPWLLLIVGTIIGVAATITSIQHVFENSDQ